MVEKGKVSVKDAMSLYFASRKEYKSFLKKCKSEFHSTIKNHKKCAKYLKK